MSHTRIFLLLFVCSMAVVVPIAGAVNVPQVHAADSGVLGELVPCGNDIKVLSQGGSWLYKDECTICHLQILAQRILSFLVGIMVAVAALLFANAGFLYVTSPANPGNISRAHGMFKTTLIGIIIILTAYVLIDTILKYTLQNNGQVFTGSGFGPWNTILCSRKTDSYQVEKLQPVQLGSGGGTGGVLIYSSPDGKTQVVGPYTQSTDPLYNEFNAKVAECQKSTDVTACIIQAQTELAAKKEERAKSTLGSISSVDAKQALDAYGIRLNTQASTGENLPYVSSGLMQKLILTNENCVGDCLDGMITSLTGGRHTENSCHYQGNCADLSSRFEPLNNGFQSAGTVTWDQGTFQKYYNPTSDMTCVYENTAGVWHYHCK